MPGFEHLAEEFLQDIADLKTVILIGRNCISAQQQKQFASPRNEHQIASETPLGWCIMGSPPPQSTKTTQKEQKKLAHRNRSLPQNRPWQMPEGPAACAWCKENNRMANHNVKTCVHFKRANKTDRRAAVDRQKVCAICLVERHARNQCPEFRGDTSRCQHCNFSHSNEIGCRPSQTGNKRPRAI